MLIKSLACVTSTERRLLSASVVWEDCAFSAQELTFEISAASGPDIAPEAAAELPAGAGADAFLAACFPLAAVHGEARIRIEGEPCPMLVEGLRTAHAWWASWGGMTRPAPQIETVAGRRAARGDTPHRAMALLSGGVDSLHMLMCNHRLYSPHDPAYIRQAVFIHGFDIGKRARDPENERYRAALARLEPVAAGAGVQLLSCRTNLRHLPSQPGFWMYRHSGAALAAAGHAALCGPGFLFIGGTYHVAKAVPFGSHPAVDMLFSTQRTRVIHEGSRFSRLEKVRALAAGWPAALAALRVCPGGAADGLNCGRCEKCLRTRLELLAAGIDETAAFGRSLASVELWREAVPMPIAETALHHEELLPALRERGYDELCRAIEAGIALNRKARVGGQDRPEAGLVN